jgi:hypothetical protein
MVSLVGPSVLLARLRLDAGASLGARDDISLLARLRLARDDIGGLPWR